MAVFRQVVDGEVVNRIVVGDDVIEVPPGYEREGPGEPPPHIGWRLVGGVWMPPPEIEAPIAGGEA